MKLSVVASQLQRAGHSKNVQNLNWPDLPMGREINFKMRILKVIGRFLTIIELFSRNHLSHAIQLGQTKHYNCIAANFQILRL